MIHSNKAFGGFSVDNKAAAKKFYEEVMGLKVEDTEMGLMLDAGNGVFVYQKDDHKPASFTVLNFPTDDIEAAAKELRDKGVAFEQYEGMTDDDGVARAMDQDVGPSIAWFKDPAGNTLSILQNK